MAKLTKLDDIVSLCKRRGFIFQSSEIYGGLASCYDYGPLGVELKRNVRNAWWKAVVQMRDDVVGLDCSILMHPLVWKASGHADKFADLVTVCKKCNTRSRVDHLAKPRRRTHRACQSSKRQRKTPKIFPKRSAPPAAPSASSREPMEFKLMFETQMGANVDDSMTVCSCGRKPHRAFLPISPTCSKAPASKSPSASPRSARASATKLPQRPSSSAPANSSRPRSNFSANPAPMKSGGSTGKKQRFNWYLNLGIKKENLRISASTTRMSLPTTPRAASMSNTNSPSAPATGRSLKASPTAPITTFASISAACEPITHGTRTAETRSKMPLTGEAEDYQSGPLSYFDEEKKKRYIPYVIEPSAGIDRSTLAFLVDAYDEEEVNGEKRNVLRFHPSLAPIKAAIFPLVKKDGMPEIAHKYLRRPEKIFRLFLR